LLDVNTSQTWLADKAYDVDARVIEPIKAIQCNAVIPPTKTFVNDKNHINGIKNFWNQAKRHLRKFNGVPKEHFHLYLKEC
jgi:transposase-like protein